MPAGPITHKGATHTCPLEQPKLHVGGPIIGDCAKHTKVGPDGNPVARIGDKADCEVTLHDTIRGGLITVWIEGQPAARQGDATDCGKVVAGLETVHLGAWTRGQPIPLWVAKWLFEYLAALKEEIPYEFTADGCFARADRMAQYIEAMGIRVEKLWVHALFENTSLALVPKAIRSTAWDWHVAPMVPVHGEEGPDVLVFDPSVDAKGPLTIDGWLTAVNQDKVPIKYWETKTDIYRCKFNGVDKDGKPLWEKKDMRDLETTRKDLQTFRDRRSEARRTDGRTAGKEVHY